MKLKKYKDFNKIEESLSEYDDFISKLEYLCTITNIETFCNGNIKQISVYNNDQPLDKVIKELEIFDVEIFDVITHDALGFDIIVSDKDFIKLNNLKTIKDLFFDKDPMGIFRYREEVSEGYWFSCIYGTFIHGYELWSNEMSDPISNISKLSEVNLYYWDWQYKNKLK